MSDKEGTTEKSIEDVKHLQSDQGGPLAIEDALPIVGGAPDPWAKGHLKLYGLCLIIYLCSTMNGYDGSLMRSINALPEYQEYYHLGNNGSAATGLVFSIFQIGQMISALFTWVCDWRGRRFAVVFGCFGVVIRSIFTALAPTLPSFIGARGTVAGVYNTLYYCGSILATSCIYGANLHLHGNPKWRLPLWLQLVCPGIVCICAWLIPESPRWLVSKGRHDEARQFITNYHANGDETHPIVAIEIAEITESLKDSGMRSVGDFFDPRPLVKSRARLYRLMLAMSMAWFGQFSGNNIASYYLPFMVENVGITATNMVLLLNAIYAVSGWIAALIGARLHDVYGRRIMLMSSCAGMALCLAIVAGTAAEYEHSGSVPASSASIAFIFVFGVVFAVAFTPMQPIYPAEVLSNDMRANGMMMYQIMAGCASFVNTFAAPTALKNIRYWFYVFFVFWDLFELAFIYFFFVETKGRTLEELDAVFEAKNPRKASTRPRDAAQEHMAA